MAVTESSNKTVQTWNGAVVTTTDEAAMHANLATALAGFQAERPRVVKDSTNPHFGNKYASLDAFEAVVLPALAKHGLAWTCLPVITQEDGLHVEYRLMHGLSGDQLVGSFPLQGGTSQQIGSALTYAKRYLLSAVTGVSADDDDDATAADSAPIRRPRETVEANWDAVVTEAEQLGDVAELRKLYVARGVRNAPAAIQAAFAAHVKSVTPEPAPTPEGEATGE